MLTASARFDDPVDRGKNTQRSAAQALTRQPSNEEVMTTASAHGFRSAILGCTLALAACATAPYGTLPPECSGVPGDLRAPNAMLVAGTATHGPATDGKPIEWTAVARPPGQTIPLLYVFGPEGEHIHRLHPDFTSFDDPAFVKAEEEGYWSEVADGAFYRIPGLDACGQAAMLGKTASFRAPARGFLFMQYVAKECSDCDAITHAIERFIARHADRPIRWVRITVPSSVGRISD